jgi:hypothetical protein
MILRVYALYGRNPFVLAFLMVLWILQVTLSSVGMTLGFGEDSHTNQTRLY